MTATSGGSDAEGRWTQRDSFEILEHALALHLAAHPFSLTTLAYVKHASALMERLPNQTVRATRGIPVTVRRL